MKILYQSEPKKIFSLENDAWAITYASITLKYSRKERLASLAIYCEEQTFPANGHWPYHDDGEQEFITITPVAWFNITGKLEFLENISPNDALKIAVMRELWLDENAISWQRPATTNEREARPKKYQTHRS